MLGSRRRNSDVFYLLVLIEKYLYEAANSYTLMWVKCASFIKDSDNFDDTSISERYISQYIKISIFPNRVKCFKNEQSTLKNVTLWYIVIYDINL